MVLLVLSSAAGAAECRKLVIAADPAYPPLHWYDGQQWHGASITVTVSALKALGLEVELRYLGPWKRVLAAAEAGSIDMVTTLKDTPERRKFLRFSTTVLMNPVAVFMSKRKTFPFAKKEDLIALRGGMARGNQFGDGFDRFLAQRLQVEQVPNLDVSFKMLDAGRFDYVITGYYPAQAFLATSGLEVRIQAVKPFLVETPNLAGFVSGSPCVSYLPAFNQQIEKMRKSGEIERLLLLAAEDWHAHPWLGGS